eukprot:GDKK01004018.1.p1 GENE.GDKK01004018.1~~GDKK01004018.1.p1  ORF type:complete len:273 (-),score=39.38 GDKK01004018.1:40-858(-)
MKITESGLRFARVSMSKDIATTIIAQSSTFLEYRVAESCDQKVIQISGKALIECLEMFTQPDVAVNISYDPSKDDHLIVKSNDRNITSICKLKIFQAELEGLDLIQQFKTSDSVDCFLLPQATLREAISEFTQLSDSSSANSDVLFQIVISRDEILNKNVIFQMIGSTTALRTEVKLSDTPQAMKVSRTHNSGFPPHLTHYLVRALTPGLGVRLQMNANGVLGMQIVMKTPSLLSGGNTQQAGKQGTMQFDLVAIPVQVGTNESFDDINHDV